MASRTGAEGRAGATGPDFANEARQSEPDCGTRGRRRRRGAGGRALKRGKEDSQRCEFGGAWARHSMRPSSSRLRAWHPPRDRCPHSPPPHVRSLSRSPFPHGGRITHAAVTVAPRAFAPPTGDPRVRPPDRRPAGSPPALDRRPAGSPPPPSTGDPQAHPPAPRPETRGFTPRPAAASPSCPSPAVIAPATPAPALSLHPPLRFAALAPIPIFWPKTPWFTHPIRPKPRKPYAF